MAGEGIGSHAQDLAGKLVVLFGGNGFLGTHVAQELLGRGARLRIACRRPDRAFRLKTLANLGQIQFVRADIRRHEMLPGLVAGADGVVNLVGAFSGDLDALHVRSAGALAAAAKAAGASAFVQISANGADTASSADYARTKAEGEAAVNAAFPGAAIMRPSVVFGPDDNFINMFARLIAMFPALPVFGPEARLQPVFVDDVAEAVANAVADPARLGSKTFELVGPEVVTMLELNRRIAAAQGRRRLFAELPDAVSGLIAALPGTPISAAQWALLRAGNVGTGLPGLKALGVTARPLGLFLERWMVRFRTHGRFGSSHGVA